MADLSEVFQILDEHQPADEKEKADVALIRRMAEAHPDLLSKECEPGHITGSALIIDLKNGRYLLHYHKSLNKWLQFGGHGEGEADPAETAMREAVEESGLTDLRFFPAVSPRPLDIDVHTIPAKNGQPEHLHLDFRYLLATEKTEPQRLDKKESGRFRWFRFDQLSDLEPRVDPGLFRLILKAKDTLEGHTPGDIPANSLTM